MSVIMPASTFTFGSGTSRYRPAVPSPLSSPPRPLSPRGQNAPPGRETQSSPVSAPSPSPCSKFRFAGRPARPNPVVQRREVAQEGRRRLFLHNVRQRADEKAWERRGGDQELLKLEWLRLNRELRQAKEAELSRFGVDQEIEQAARLHEEMARAGRYAGLNCDDEMADVLAREEEVELEALISSMPHEEEGEAAAAAAAAAAGSPTAAGYEPAYFSDEDDYDSLFVDFAAQEGSRQSSSRGSQEMACSQDMDLS